MFKSSLLKPLNHGFLTRRGGVSSAPFDSLSFVVGKGDDPENVRKNRQIAVERLGIEGKELVTVNQVHGTCVILVDKPWTYGVGETPDADAIVTQNPNLVLGIFTADCVPILLYDEPTQTIAAVHAGWRGAQKGVVGETVRRMSELGVKPETIKAAIGPCIFQNHYEVGPEVLGEFTSLNPSNAKFFKDSPNPGKHMFDLPGAVLEQLLNLGIGNVDMMGLDTYTMESEFFSCRRSFHRNEKTFGCMLSAVSLA
jgi:YfiH family protein